MQISNDFSRYEAERQIYAVLVMHFQEGITQAEIAKLTNLSHAKVNRLIKQGRELVADSTGLAVLVVRPHLVWGPGDTQLVARIVARARARRLPVLGSGAALIDTTYVDNAATALAAAVSACGPVHGEPLVVSNGEPRPVAEVLTRLCQAAAAPGPRGHVPFRAAWVAGAAVEGVWALTRWNSTPPMTRFLAEQLATAHWFDQRRTRAALDWVPHICLDEGFSRLAAWYTSRPGG